MDEVETEREGGREAGQPPSPHLSVMAGFPALAVLFSLLYVVYSPQDTGKHRDIITHFLYSTKPPSAAPQITR